MKILNALLFLGIFISSITGFSQNDINQMDADGKRHGIWKKTYPGTEQLRYEGKFEHGKEVGEFKFYCEDCKNQPTIIKTFNKSDNIADVKYFTKKGKLVSEGKMQGKERIGEWVYYHEKSKVVMSRENYLNDELHGKVITYYPNGKITQETDYKHGKKDGEDNYYSVEGVLLKKLPHYNDQIHGQVFYYDAYGNVVIEGHYKHGKKHGLWKYYKDGQVALEETFPKKNRE